MGLLSVAAGTAAMFGTRPIRTIVGIAATLGKGLIRTAQASDGTIEGIEALDREFVLGVQWHAECLIDRPAHAALFDGFIAAAERFDEARTRFARVA